MSPKHQPFSDSDGRSRKTPAALALLAAFALALVSLGVPVAAFADVLPTDAISQVDEAGFGPVAGSVPFTTAADTPPTDTTFTDAPSPQDADAGAPPPEQPVAPKPESVPPAYPAEPPPVADPSAAGDLTATQPPEPVAGAIVPDTETAATPDTGAVYSGGGDVIEQALTLTASGQDAAWRAHARGVLPPGMELSTAGGATAGGSQTDAAKAGGTHTGATMAEATTVDGTKTDAFEGGSTSAAASAAGPAAVEPPAGASAEVRESESRNGVNASIVPRPSFNPGRLAHTGFEAGWLVLLGAGLALLGGFFAVLAVRRRRTDEAEEADSP